MRSLKLSFQLLLTFSFIAWLGSCNSPSDNASEGKKADTATQAAPAPVAKKTVKLVIQYKKDSSKTIDSIPITKEKFSVADAMAYARDERKNLTFDAKSGFLNGIDGLMGEGAKKFWWLCVNDTSSDVGFEGKYVKENDKIVWHFLVGEQDGCKTCYCNFETKKTYKK